MVQVATQERAKAVQTPDKLKQYQEPPRYDLLLQLGDGLMINGLAAHSRFISLDQASLARVTDSRYLYNTKMPPGLKPDQMNEVNPNEILYDAGLGVLAGVDLRGAEEGIIASLLIDRVLKLPNGENEQAYLREPSLYYSPKGEPRYMASVFNLGFADCNTVFSWESDTGGARNVHGWGMRQVFTGRSDKLVKALIPSAVSLKNSARTNFLSSASVPALGLMYDFGRLGEWQQVPSHLSELNNGELKEAQLAIALALTGVFKTDTGFLKEFPELAEYAVETERILQGQALKGSRVAVDEIDHRIRRGDFSDASRIMLAKQAQEQLYDPNYSAIRQQTIDLGRGRYLKYSHLLWVLEDIKFSERGEGFNIAEMLALARLWQHCDMKDSQALDGLQVLADEYSARVGLANPIRVALPKRQTFAPPLPQVSEKQGKIKSKKPTAIEAKPAAQPRPQVDSRLGPWQRWILTNVGGLAGAALVASLAYYVAPLFYDAVSRTPALPAGMDFLDELGIAQDHTATIYKTFATGTYMPEPGSLTLKDAIRGTDRRHPRSPYLQVKGENAGFMSYKLGIPHNMQGVGSQNMRIVAMPYDARDLRAALAISDYTPPVDLQVDSKDIFGEAPVSNNEAVQATLAALSPHIQAELEQQGKPDNENVFRVIDLAYLQRSVSPHLEPGDRVPGPSVQEDEQFFPVVMADVAGDGTTTISSIPGLQFHTLLRPETALQDPNPGKQLVVLWVVPGVEKFNLDANK